MDVSALVQTLEAFAALLAHLYATAPVNPTPTQANVRDRLVATGMACDALVAEIRTLSHACAAMAREAGIAAPSPTPGGNLPN